MKTRLELCPTILLVDPDAGARHATAELLESEGYECVSASGVGMAVELASSREISLVLSEVDMPQHDGFWLLEKLKENYPDTPFILLSGQRDTESAIDSLRRGAADYLLKPTRTTVLVRAIERALAKRRIELARKRYQSKLEGTIRERTTELEAAVEKIAQSYQETLLALVNALDAREHETSHHSQRVLHYTTAVAGQMGFYGKELEEIGRGALLHDIGKIGVPDAVLLKPDRLTPNEWLQMRDHPEIGYKMIRDIPFLAVPASIVLTHQEQWDGSGYPKHLERFEIPIGARIFAVADALDAMTSDRPYRNGTSVSNAIAEICRCGGTQFDPAVVRAFVSLGEPRLAQIRDGMEQRATAGRSIETGMLEDPELVQVVAGSPLEDFFTRMARAQHPPDVPPISS